MIVRQPGLLRPVLRSRLYRWPVAATAAFLIASGTCVAQGAPASAASAVSAAIATSVVGASEPVSAIGLPAAQYTVRAGESLNDVAIAVTQSHDRATLARAARALFDANPAAFMGHDPSRMKIGAVMNVPTLDASGVVVGASGAAGASASQSAAASAPTGNASASAASVMASAAAGASAAQSASASVAQASSTPSSSSSSAADTTQAGSQPSVAPQDAHASGAHVWSGAIQQSASAPEAASQPRAQVSSLQQLLALKNRVLMELQKHGIGSTGQPKTGADGASTAAVAPAASASASGAAVVGGSTVPVTQAGSGSSSNGGQFGFTQTQLGIAAVIGAALVVLLTGLSMRKRRPAKPAADAAKQTDTPARPATLLEKDAAAYAARLKEQQPEADEPASTGHDDGENAKPAETPTAAAEHPTLDGATTAASLAAAAVLGADALPTQTIQPVDENQPYVDEPQHVDGGTKEDEPPSLNDATTTASLAAATELGADALPPASLEADEEHDTPSPAVEPTPALVPVPFPRDAMAALGSLDLSLPPRSGPAADVPSLPATTHAEPEPAPHEPAPLADIPMPPPVEPHAAEHPVLGASTESHTAEQPTPAASTESYAAEQPTSAASTESHIAEQLEPTVSTESPAAEHPTPTPPEPDITAAAATTSTAAIAGLGAARFGALNLDFDLELPPSPAQPIPAFTPEELARIARNKLDLASEYIALGDLNGARTLINEVIAANDTGTRDEARALLSTLAPLS